MGCLSVAHKEVHLTLLTHPRWLASFRLRFSWPQTTKLDVCDESAVCQGTDVAHLISQQQQDLASLTGTTEEIRNVLEAMQGVCCDAAKGLCCSPCDDPQQPCQAGTFDKLYYLQ